MARTPAKKLSVSTREVSPDTRVLREGLKKFLETPHQDPASGKSTSVGKRKYGVYAFYDYDGERIYVGQTVEGIATRIRRHLTNQRTDAVAMSVLDPFEVRAIEVWPLSSDLHADAKSACNDLEYAVYAELLKRSKFRAILNEKIPQPGRKISLPPSTRGEIVEGELLEARSHPDVRIARRAMTIARLSQVISERKVQPGLRRSLEVQARRLASLAEDRFGAFEDDANREDAKSDEEDDE